MNVDSDKDERDGFKSLDVYKLAYKLALDIYYFSKTFPSHELFLLTRQIRRSSRSICANIGEGYRKKQYVRHFASKMSDADGECSETLIWLDFSKDCQYISLERYNQMCADYSRVGQMLGSMIKHPERFLPKK